MASLTENRRYSWEMIVWPLILELDRPFFTVREYQTKRDYLSKIWNTDLPELDLVLFV